MENAYKSVLEPILYELRDHLSSFVIIGGWVPELYRRFGEGGEWAVKPLATSELDVLLDEDEAASENVDALAERLRAAGFEPIGDGSAKAIWERDASSGERIEFFLDHTGPWEQVAETREVGSGEISGIALRDLGLLSRHSVTLRLAADDVHNDDALAVRVPELGAFLVLKGATFRRRPVAAKRAKDLHYIVDVMASGDAQVDAVQAQILSYCGLGGAIAELARSCRNLVQLVVTEPPDSELRQRLAEALEVRHALSKQEADARAVGYLNDFVELIPQECGDAY